MTESLREFHQVENNNDSNGANKIDDGKNSYNDKVNIKISDTGGGIPVDILPRLFEKFTTMGRKGNRQGTGLGLFIAKSIIAAHNGVIRVYNNEIGGATFSIILPSN